MFGAEEENEEVESKSSRKDECLGSELGEPTEMSNPTSNEETKCGDHPTRVVVEEEHHSWPVVLVINETSKLTKPQERAKKRKINDRNRKRIEGWCKMEKKKTLQFTHDQSSRYMSCIRFLPGSNMYHLYSISIRVILELFIKFRAFIEHTS
ncbi:hypothetical protein Hdeb2414_s0030g00707541 [Helianthus debilis subsp. tardiflorus]